MDLIVNLLFHLVFSVPILRTVIFTVAPALLLLQYVRKKDSVEKESPKLVWSLVGLGGLSIVLAYVLESIGGVGLSWIIDPYSDAFNFLYYFLIVGLVEEASKYFVMSLRTWKNPEFNCLFDGLVYAVAVSAGFALFENVLYLIRYGSSVVFIRAIVSIPGHICFAVFMGSWYSAAKKYEKWGDLQKKKHCQALAIIVPAIAHGLFDVISDYIETGFGLIVFGIYVIAMFIISWKMMKRMADKDTQYNEMHPGT